MSRMTRRGLRALAAAALVLPIAMGVAGAPAQAAPKVTRERVVFTSAGTKLVGFHYSGSSARNRPVIVMAPGFGSVQLGKLPGFAQRFAAAGYDAFTFDYRSWGESSGSPRNVMDIQKQLADWRAAITFARTLPGVDDDKVVLWGSSMAGGHVLTVAADQPRLAAVIAQVPHVDGIAAATGSGRPFQITAQLAAAGVEDSARAAAGLSPKYVPIVGKPGSFAAMAVPGAYESYTASPGPAPKWTNKVSARVILQLPFYSPKNDAPRSTTPTFIGVADGDLLTPPKPAADLAVAMKAELRTYSGGHFDVYQGRPIFEKILADELSFLKRQVRPARVG